MENKIHRSYTPYNPPENNSDRPANHRQTPSPAINPDQSIESALSRLNISSDAGFLSQPTFSCYNQVFDNGIAPSSYSIPPSMAFAGSQQGLLLNQYYNHQLNGPHRSSDVGSASAAAGPNLPALYSNQLMYSQRQGFDDENIGRNRMHGKEPMFVNEPALPFPWENSYCSSLCTDQHLYEPQQQLNSEGVRSGIASLDRDQVLDGLLNLKLKGLSESEMDSILLQLMGSWNDLLMDKLGSQFVLKLFWVCNENQRTEIIIAIFKFPHNPVMICSNTNGARAIQKLMENLYAPEHISYVIQSLARGVLSIATDPNGQNVIHFCVRRFPGECAEHLLKEITRNCYRLATDKSGCCLLQSCVDISRGEARSLLINEIVANAVHLAEDPYGNYVVQHLLGLDNAWVTNCLLKRFQGCFVILSCNKYASNVVEKMLESGEGVSTAILVELVTSPNALRVLLDPFGNFVIQSGLSVAKGGALNLLVKLIRDNARTMQSNIYGRKILGFQKRMFYYNA